MDYQKDLKKIMILYPDLEILSSEDFIDLINIHNIAESTFKDKFDSKLVVSSFNNRKIMNLKNINDYFYLIFKTAIFSGNFKKFAYPNMNEFADIQEQFDLEKWAGLVYKIYDAVTSGDMNLQTALDYYAETLDKRSDEDQKFKKWFKYYQNGEHLKYSKEKEEELKKQAFQFPLNGGGFYGGETSPILPKEFSLKHKLENEEKKDNYLTWREKLHSAIRRIDKLLRQSDDYVDPDSQRELADLLHQFDQEVRSLRQKVTASDLAYKYANKFKKLGYHDIHHEFMKYSQELTEPETVPEPEPKPAAEMAEEPTTPKIPEESTGDTALERAVSGASSAAEGEYEELAGNVGLGDAVSKLEEIAGRLSDRRTIRLLAEFDIMLDKIGIAAMFPELAEAQSKLIDGYSYALTRVTKMLGMLSSGKSLIEISDAKKKDLNNKTMKEVNKTLEPEEETPERGTPAIQEGVNESKKPELEQQPVAEKQE